MVAGQLYISAIHLLENVYVFRKRIRVHAVRDGKYVSVAGYGVDIRSVGSE